MISLEQARLIAERALEDAPKSRPLRLLEEPEAGPTHWIFRFDSVEYLETGDPRLGVFGGGPIAVAKADGTVTWLGDEADIDDLLRS